MSGLTLRRRQLRVGVMSRSGHGTQLWTGWPKFMESILKSYLLRQMEGKHFIQHIRSATMLIRTITTISILVVFHIAHAVTDKEQAQVHAQEAVKLMESGSFKKSIGLLEKAIKLDPGKIVYSYELAYAHCLKKDYKTAIGILKGKPTAENVSAEMYQLLGNCYDMLGKTEKALEVYDAGLEKFPKSGAIYLEKGIVYRNRKEFDNALKCFEKGIRVNPSFPSNYYRATLIYCDSPEEVWGMIYGEIFMNLERGSERTVKISKLFYDTYKDRIKFTSGKSYSISFYQNSISAENTKSKPEITLPFALVVYEPLLAKAVADENKIDLHSLDRIRTRFVKEYFANRHDIEYPNILFKYQKKIFDAGHFESYNHWLLSQGDETAFNK